MSEEKEQWREEEGTGGGGGGGQRRKNAHNLCVLCVAVRKDSGSVGEGKREGGREAAFYKSSAVHKGRGREEGPFTESVSVLRERPHNKKGGG